MKQDLTRWNKMDKIEQDGTGDKYEQDHTRSNKVKQDQTRSNKMEQEGSRRKIWNIMKQDETGWN
jgi:hypothetical protein